jgi:hypothetical protein
VKTAQTRNRRRKKNIKPASVTAGVAPSTSDRLHLVLAAKLAILPRDVGAVVLGLGTAGLVIPGPIPPGVPFVVLGVILLRPSLVSSFGEALARRYPRFFRLVIRLIDRLLTDLARRYPGSIRGSPRRRPHAAAA